MQLFKEVTQNHRLFVFSFPPSLIYTSLPPDCKIAASPLGMAATFQAERREQLGQRSSGYYIEKAKASQVPLISFYSCCISLNWMTRPTQKARDSEDGNIFNEAHFYTNTVGGLLVRKKRKSIFGEKNIW